MAKSHPHPKKGGGEPAPEPAMPDSADVAASELRAQVARLAEQVRGLGDRADAERSGTGRMDTGFAELGDLLVPKPRRPRHAPSAVEQAPPPSPAPHAQQPPPEPSVQTAVAAVEGGGAREGAVEAGGERTGGGGGDTFAERSSRLVASVVALAELAAIEIRTGAEIEAAALRAHSRERPNEPSTSHLLALLERQRHMLAALAAQTERLERAAAVLRAQISALEAEREHISDLLGTARRTP
jgi:hypothetical protein